MAERWVIKGILWAKVPFWKLGHIFKLMLCESLKTLQSINVYYSEYKVVFNEIFNYHDCDLKGMISHIMTNASFKCLCYNVLITKVHNIHKLQFGRTNNFFFLYCLCTCIILFHLCIQSITSLLSYTIIMY